MPLFKRKYPRCAAVVAAAGSATRMGEDKLLAHLDREPVLVHTLRALSESPYLQELIVVTRAELLEEVSRLCREHGFTKVTAVLAGGATRLESVYRGVNQVPADVKYIAIHDGARPLVSQAVIAAAVEGAMACGAAAPAVAVKDTVKTADNGAVTGTLDRSALRAVQTPQVFDADLIRAALHQAVAQGTPVTDDCSAVEALGKKVLLVPGEERNIKLTTPIDLVLAHALLEVRG